MRTALVALLVVTMACMVSVDSLRAEVSTDLVDGVTGTLIMGIIVEGADPIGLFVPFRSIDTSRMLNPSGADREDGRPDVAYLADGKPVAVWAYNNGAEHDIAFAEWDGFAWSTTEFLTTGSGNDLDPRIHNESDGTLHVVWWRGGAAKEVFISTRQPGSSTWSIPDLVATSASRPSVVMFDGDLWVAFERSPAQIGIATDVVISKKIAASFQIQHAIGTTNSSRLDPIIHTQGSKLWVDWIHDAGNFGCVEYDSSSWGSTVQEPWINSSWVGVAELRQKIRRGIVGQ